MTDAEVRFWDKVRIGDGCWEWTASKVAGYGAFGFGRRVDRANRVSWRFAHGAIAPGLHVLHRCDNRACVRPSHLFLGTNAENIADRVAKGRSLRGTQHHHSKVTEEQVVEIRARAQGGESQASLCRAFGLSANTMFKLVHRQTWRHVP